MMIHATGLEFGSRERPEDKGFALDDPYKWRLRIIVVSVYRSMWNEAKML